MVKEIFDYVSGKMSHEEFEAELYTNPDLWDEIQSLVPEDIADPDCPFRQVWGNMPGFETNNYRVRQTITSFGYNYSMAYGLISALVKYKYPDIVCREPSDELYTKDDFLLKVATILKQRKYKRRKNYWYLAKNNLIFCIYVQGSQWNKNNYYVNIGVKEDCLALSYPTELHWTWWHRCTNTNGQEINISIQSLVDCFDMYFNDYVSMDVKEFYSKYKAIKIGERWIVL